jgi:alpha-tubulin suppressor-like RCC1 family protein
VCRAGPRFKFVRVSPILCTGSWCLCVGGYNHRKRACVTAGGDIYYCGENQFGQFGIPGVSTSQEVGSPKRLASGNFVQIAAGESHLIGLKADGTVYAWGLNNYGQSGGSGVNALPQHELPCHFALESDVVYCS